MKETKIIATVQKRELLVPTASVRHVYIADANEAIFYKEMLQEALNSYEKDLTEAESEITRIENPESYQVLGELEYWKCVKFCIEKEIAQIKFDMELCSLMERKESK